MWVQMLMGSVIVTRILGLIPDLLTCVGAVMGIVLTYWLTRKARTKTLLTEEQVLKEKAKTLLTEREIALKDIELAALREQDHKIITP